MIVMRNDQVQAFRDASRECGVDLVVQHLRDVFPEESAELGDDLRDTARYAIQVADSYGITSMRCVCLYADLMFVLGLDFDQDPEHAWSQDILSDESLTQDEAMGLLCRFADPEEDPVPYCERMLQLRPEAGDQLHGR